MGTITARELGRNTAGILDELARTGRPQLVLRNGKPIATLNAVDEDEFDDFLLANAPGLAESLAEADEDAKAGRLLRAEDVYADLEASRPRRKMATTRRTTSRRRAT